MTLRSISQARPAEIVQTWIFNVQRFCSDDGPGIRTCVFLKGCPLRCPWCHNPESQLPKPQISFDNERCLHCGACSRACPHQLIGKGAPFPDPSLCTQCGKCVDACPSDARKFIGEATTVGELMTQILKDRAFYEESGGGVTFSGGEPLTHVNFLIQMLQACRKVEISTAVDTCGYARKEDVLEVAKHADLFLFDLKQIDDEHHRALTGVSNVRILENLRALAEAEAKVWIRIPLIPGCNASNEDINAFGQFIASLPKRYPVWLLPYHELGRHKHERLGMPEAPLFREPSHQEVAQAAQILRGYGLDVHTRNPS